MSDWFSNLIGAAVWVEGGCIKVSAWVEIFASLSVNRCLTDWANLNLLGADVGTDAFDPMADHGSWELLEMSGNENLK